MLWRYRWQFPKTFPKSGTWKDLYTPKPLRNDKLERGVRTRDGCHGRDRRWPFPLHIFIIRVSQCFPYIILIRKAMVSLIIKIILHYNYYMCQINFVRCVTIVYDASFNVIFTWYSAVCPPLVPTSFQHWKEEIKYVNIEYAYFTSRHHNFLRQMQSWSSCGLILEDWACIALCRDS